MRIIRKASKKPIAKRIFAKRRFSEGEEYESLESFHEKLDELEQVAQELVDKYGKEVTDNMNVIFWAKDENGTPVLVEGDYKYWSGDEEITISEIAEGERPVDFEKKLKKAFIEIPEINYQIAVEEDDLPDPEVANLETFILFGWEYATTKQGNLYMQGRVNHIEGPDFGEVFVDDGFAHSNLRDYDGDHEAEDINEKGLQKLAKAISSGTTEQPRFSRSKLIAKKSPKGYLCKKSFALKKEEIKGAPYYELEGEEKTKLLDYLQDRNIDEYGIISDKISMQLKNVKLKVETLPNGKDVFTGIIRNDGFIFVDRPKNNNDLTIHCYTNSTSKCRTILIKYENMKLYLEFKEGISLDDIFDLA